MSKQAHGVDVCYPALRHGNSRQKTNWIVAANNDLPAKLATNPGDKSRGRSNQGDIRHAPGVPLLFNQLVHSLALPLALSIAGVGVEEARQSAEGRV